MQPSALKNAYDLLWEMAQNGAIRPKYTTATNEVLRELLAALKAPKG